MMKAWILAVAVLAVCSFASVEAMRGRHVVINDAEIQTAFAQFIHDFNRQYAAAEVAQKYQVFADNYRYIEMHNLMAVQKGQFTMAINQFADMTHDEFKQTMLTRRPTPSEPETSIVTRRNTALPATVDWRNEGVVVDVKDQGSCGSCWAFAAAAAMESAWALANHTLTSLSEQQMLDCVYNVKDICEQGGLESDGMDWALKVGGSMSEKAYPYTAKDGQKCSFNASQIVANFKKHTHVRPRGDETALATSISIAPTTIAMDASQRSFQFYNKGVYQDAACKNDLDDLDHAILAVGYGTDSSTGQNYYIVKNSWGTVWGLKGYFEILKDGSGSSANMCGVATDANFISA